MAQLSGTSGASTEANASNEEGDNTVPNTHGLQLLAGLASPASTTFLPLSQVSTGPLLTSQPSDQSVLVTTRLPAGATSPQSQSKVTVPVQQMSSSDLIQVKSIGQPGQQTFYITQPVSSATNIVGKQLKLQTSGGKPCLIQSPGGLVTNLQSTQTGQKILLTGANIQQSTSNVGGTILTNIPTTSTVQVTGKPIMVTQQNQGQIRLVTKTSPVQQATKSPSQPVKLQLQVKDASLLQKLQQASGQVVTLGGQSTQSDSKQPVRLVLPGTSSSSSTTGQIQLIQTQQGLQKVITVQQPQQQQTIQLQQQQGKAPVQFALLPQASSGGTGTRLVVVPQNKPSTEPVTSTPTSPRGKSAVLTQPGTIRIVLPSQASGAVNLGNTVKTITTTAASSAPNVIQILGTRVLTQSSPSNTSTVAKPMMKIIPSSGAIGSVSAGSTASTPQTCLIVPSSGGSSLGKAISIVTKPQPTGGTPSVSNMSPTRSGSTLVRIVSGAGGQQIATVITTSANAASKATQNQQSVRTVQVVSPSQKLSPKGSQGKNATASPVKFITTLPTTSGISTQNISKTSTTLVKSQAVPASAAVVTKSLTTKTTSSPQISGAGSKVVTFTSVLPKSTDQATTSVVSKSLVTSNTRVSSTSPSTTSSGSTSQVHKMVRILPSKPGQKPTQLVILVNQTANIGEEVKKIGEELNKLQSQPKTQDTVDKLKELQSRLQQLQVAAQLSAKAKSLGDASGSDSLDGPLPTNEKERKKMIKQRKLQEKANRIIAEAVAKAKAAGKSDIPKVLKDDEEIPAELMGEIEQMEAEAKKKKKEKKDRSKSKKPKDSKQPKEKKVKEKKVVSIKKKPKKIPAAAFLKLKRHKRKHGEFSESSDLDETPPPSPPPNEFNGPGIEKRRSARNTSRKRYTEDYDFNITSDDSSDDDDKEKKKKKKEEKKLPIINIQHKPKVEKQEEDVDIEGTSEIDVVSFEPTETAKFFVDNPDESQANVVERILASRIVKKPQIPGEAQVGEIEEFYVKYRNFSYLHCEWAALDKLSADPRIFQKVKRFRIKRQSQPQFGFITELEEDFFNPDYIEVDRILDKAITKEDWSDEEVTHYLVKWRSLPYEDSTWELAEDVDNAKIKLYEKYNKSLGKSERHRNSRPKSSEWKKLDKTPKYKDGNVLREYQLEGVNWLTFSWCNNQNCILADEMGLGKTIQTIGFLQEVQKFGIRGPFLVLAPLSTITNWQREVESWTDMNCVVYHGGSQSRHMIAEYEMFYKDDKGQRIPDIYKFHILITTYEILLADCQELSEIEWRVVVIDEAHRLKNRNCKLLEGLKILDMEHRVLLTGTPLQNNVEELFSLLNFLEPGRFRSSTQFMEDFGDLKTEGQVERLQQLLRPMMLRRLKEDVEKNLAPKEETIIEVEMTSIQKRYYRAILEKNFSFLTKGAGSATNLPNLMNTMMELRKCCNHPFLINGGEEQIVKEFIASENLDLQTRINVHENPLLHMKVLIQSAGKMVLLDKLLPKLRDGGHKVLIFSQMIRCLDILEDYLIQKRYTFERIDGRVRGNMRQAAIDRFSKPDSDRFVFLLCTRAGGLGINLTAADTCIIFDSDWNPQNDLQAQARCHRIGQQKAVKVYRLITRNSYEREMFDKASMKLGLDKAVLQSMRGEKDSYSPQQALSKKEIEDLLRRGAYGAIMDDDDQSSKFCAEDIDMILQRRTQVIQHKPGMKGSSFAKASFTVSSDHTDIKIDDPDFWHKWAKRAEIDLTSRKDDRIINAPRQRTKTRRFGNMDEILDMSSDDSDDSAHPPHPPVATQKKQREKRDPSQRPIKKQLQSGWTRLECFRVEKGLLTFGWGRWDDIMATTRFKRRLGEKDVEAISRTMLIYCLQHYKGDENIKSFIWDLVTPSPDGTVRDCRNHRGLSAPVPRGRKGKKPKKEPQAAILEYDFTAKDQNPELLLTDQGYKNHLKRHCNKVLLRVRLLYYLKQEVIGDLAEQIENDVSAKNLPLVVPSPEGEPPISWWDTEADHSLLIGVYKHGYEKYAGLRLDQCLCFRERCGIPDHREIIAAQAQEDEEFNDSQLDVEGGEGGGDGDMDGGGDVDLGTDGVDGTDHEIELKAIPKHIKDDADDESLSPFSTRPSSPATDKTKASNVVLIPAAVPGKLPFPSAPDLNTRLRRLVAAYQRENKKKQLKAQKRERKEQVKLLRMQEQLRQRELRKIENAQKWSRREEADFYRILTAFGVEKDPDTGKFKWENFKRLAKLDRKYEEKMTEFYEHYYAMCLRVCKRAEEIPEGYASTPLQDFTIEEITEERASKCLSRIELMNKIRNEIRPHPDLDERLKKCRRSMELPDWWELGRHDKDLITGVCRYGINRLESQHAMMNDEELCFKELKEKFPMAAAMSCPSSTATPAAPRKLGLKKPGPKKGTIRKKKQAVPPAPTTPSTGEVAVDGVGIPNESKDETCRENGSVVVKAENHETDERTEFTNEVSALGGDDDVRTSSELPENVEVSEAGFGTDSMDKSPAPDPETSLGPDNMDMSQGGISEDEMDEGLGSCNDDDDDDDDMMDRMEEDVKPTIKQEVYLPEDSYEARQNEEEKSSESDDVKTEYMPHEVKREYDPYQVKQENELYEVKQENELYEVKQENQLYDVKQENELYDVKQENELDDLKQENEFREEKPDVKYEALQTENMFGDNDNLHDGTLDGSEETPTPMSVLQRALLKGDETDTVPKVESKDADAPESGKAAKANSTKKRDTTPKVVVPTFRWPKDRVIVHRLEQLSHLVLNNEWPGRKHHHHLNPALMEGLFDEMDTPGPRGGLEHNYAGGFPTGRKRPAQALNPDGTVKKKKKKKKLMLDAQRAAQFAALMRQNQAMMAAFTGNQAYKHPMMSSPEDPTAMPAPPAATAAPQSSNYHIHDTEFKAVPDFVREGRGPAEGKVVGVLDLSRKGLVKKKKKLKLQHGGMKVDGKLIKIKKPVPDGTTPLVKQLKKKKKKHKHKVSDGSGHTTDHTGTSTAASESQESQEDIAAAVALPTSQSPPVKKRKRLKNPVRLDTSQITGEEKVGMVSRESGKRLAGKHCPSLSNLSEWLVKHPTYNVAMEWGHIVKTKGNLPEELKDRIATSKSRHVPIKPAVSPATNVAPAPTQLALGGIPASKVTMQIAQNTLGGLTFPAAFPNVGVGQVLASPPVSVAASVIQSVQPQGMPPKKKKKKVSSGGVTTVKKNILPRTVTVDANSASQLAGISPFLLPNTSNVFFSPFLASQGLLSTATNAVAISSPGSTATGTSPLLTPTVGADKAAKKTPRKRKHTVTEDTGAREANVKVEAMPSLMDDVDTSLDADENHFVMDEHLQDSNDI